jgi:hypothetical protein
MMRHPEEISAWSLEELEAEIAAALPHDWVHRSITHANGYWTARFGRPEDSGVSIELERQGPDKRLVLLDVYGELWLRTVPPAPEGSPWVRRNEPAASLNLRPVRGSHVPDPEDLDPSEVERVHKSRK